MPTMFRTSERYVPASTVECTRLDHATVLTASDTGESLALSPTGVEVWAMLQDERRTVDRLVMGLARRSSGYALAELPDQILAELDSFIQRGFVERVAAV
jgi:hypothetical protein